MTPSVVSQGQLLALQDPTSGLNVTSNQTQNFIWYYCAYAEIKGRPAQPQDRHDRGIALFWIGILWTARAEVICPLRQLYRIYTEPWRRQYWIALMTRAVEAFEGGREELSSFRDTASASATATLIDELPKFEQMLTLYVGHISSLGIAKLAGGPGAVHVGNESRYIQNLLFDIWPHDDPRRDRHSRLVQYYQELFGHSRLPFPHVVDVPDMLDMRVSLDAIGIERVAHLAQSLKAQRGRLDQHACVHDAHVRVAGVWQHPFHESLHDAEHVMLLK